MVNLSCLLSARACRAYDCPRLETDTLLSWRRKTGGVSLPVAPSGPLRNAKRVGVEAAVCCVAPDQDPTIPPEDSGLDLSFASEGLSSGKTSDSLGPAMLVEEMAASRDNVQAGLSRVPGQSLRGEMNKGKRYPSNMTEQGPHCTECRGICTVPAHDMRFLTSLDGLSHNELGGSPDVAASHASDSAGTRASSRCTLSRTSDYLVHTR